LAIFKYQPPGNFQEEIMGTNNYKLVVLWYAVPLLYLILAEGVFLLNSTLILIVFLVALSVGFYSFRKVEIGKPVVYPFLKTFFKIVFWLTALIQAYGFYRVLVDGFDLTRYRADFFEATGGIFKSTYLYTLYNVFLMPLFLLGVMYWLNQDMKIKSVRKLILLAFLVIVLDGVLRLGRFQYLYVVFFFYLSFRAFGVKKIVFFIILSAVGVISFLTIYFRQFFVDAAVDSAFQIVNAQVFRNSILNYQYNGYIFLDNLVESKSIFGHPWEMNTASFGFQFIKTITTKFGFDFNYPWESYNLILTEGMYHEKLDIFFNAFSTNFLPVYLDLGYLGIFGYGLFSGIFLGFRTDNTWIKTLQYLNLFILIFGLYQPVITTLIGLVLLIAFAWLFLSVLREYRRVIAIKKINFNSGY
jgi:hypothetical protein